MNEEAWGDLNQTKLAGGYYKLVRFIAQFGYLIAKLIPIGRRHRQIARQKDCLISSSFEMLSSLKEDEFSN